MQKSSYKIQKVLSAELREYESIWRSCGRQSSDSSENLPIHSGGLPAAARARSSAAGASGSLSLSSLKPMASPHATTAYARRATRPIFSAASTAAAASRARAPASSLAACAAPTTWLVAVLSMIRFHSALGVGEGGMSARPSSEVSRGGDGTRPPVSNLRPCTTVPPRSCAYLSARRARCARAVRG